MNRTSARAVWRQFLHYSVVVLMLVCSVSVTGCTSQQASTKQQIKANFDVKVEDPSIKRLTNVTEKVQVIASGDFENGTYFIKNSVVSIPPKTTFQLNLTLPIENPDVVSTANAVGTFSTNNQISFNTVPVPREIKLDKGTVSGEVDLARTMGAFFVNMIQVGAMSSDMKDMVSSLRIEKVVLDLRPDSIMKLGEKELHIGPDSRVELVDAVFDTHLNYVGTCKLNINFAKNCKWIGESVDCLFDGGKIESQFQAKKYPDRLVLSLPDNISPEQNKPATLENCTFNFGKNKRSSATAKSCVGVVKEFTWQQIKGEDHPTLHLVSTMDMRGTDLHLKTDIHQTIGHFPDRVPGKLVCDIKKDGRSTDFETTGNAHAQKGQIIIEKTNTKLVLSLENVTVGPSSFAKEGALKFSLEGGVANIRSLAWEHGANRFDLNCGSGSTLTLPSEMLLEKADPSGSTEMKLPLKLNLGKARLHAGNSSIDLANLDGEIMIHVDKEIQLKSELSFGLQNLTILDGFDAEINAKGLDLTVKDGKTKLIIKRCSIVVSDEPLKEAIKKKIPDTLEFKLHKTIKEDKSWRYRNAIAENAKITNLSIDDMHAKGPSSLAFTASGDAYVDGTIEKTGIILDKDKWETKPWNISGHVKEEGVVTYKFLKKKGHSGDDHQLKYELVLDLKVPDDIKLDWSQVASGILKVAEKKVILGRLKKIDIPVRHSGEINLIKKESPAWKNLAISNVSVKDAPDGGTQIDFHAETSFSKSQKQPSPKG